jgi:hypothetical protein
MEQVDDHFLNTRGISHHLRKDIAVFTNQLDSGSFCLGLHALDGRFKEVLGFHGGDVEGHSAAFDLRQLQEFLHHLGHVVNFIIHQIEEM